MKWFWICLFCILATIRLETGFTYTLPLQNKNITIDVALFINDITAVHEKTESIEVELTLYQQWKDPHLAFDTKKFKTPIKYYYNNDALRKLSTIWHPNLVITQIRGEPEIQKTFLKISADGVVTLIQRINAEVETVIDIRKFPFDNQTFKITFAPFSKNYDTLNFSIMKDKQGIASNAHLAEWKILGYTGKTSISHSRIFANKIPKYTLTIQYQREWMFYLFKLLLPLFIIISLSWSVFWIRKQPVINSIAVIFTALLTIVAFQWVLMATIPRVSYPTFFQTLILFSYITIGLTIIALAIKDNNIKRTRQALSTFFKIFFPIFYIVGVFVISFIFF